MTMPKVKSELIHTLGLQMQNKNYMYEVEKNMWYENPELAKMVNVGMQTMDVNIKDKDNLSVANIVGRSLVLLVYQAIREQMTCDELE